MRFTTSLVDKFASRMVEIPDQRCCFCLPWWHTQTFPATENNQVFKQFVSSSSAQLYFLGKGKTIDKATITYYGHQTIEIVFENGKECLNLDGVFDLPPL